jgi:hypothetical protein
MTYYEKLKDPRWQKLRLEVFERNKWTCFDCGAKDRQLHAHHAYYEKGLEPWDYDANMIMCLCDKCHTRRHSAIEIITSYSGLMPIGMLENVAKVVRLTRVMYNSNNAHIANKALRIAITTFKNKLKSKSMVEKHGDISEELNEL